MTTTDSGTALARPERGLTLAMVTEMTGYDLPRIALVRTQMAKSMNVTAEQVTLQDLAMFLNAERTLGLDSLLRQIHWISRGGKGGIQVGIDGYRAVAERTSVYAGSEPPRFGGMIEQSYMDGQDRKTMLVPEKASVVVWKIVAGHKAAFTGEAWWTEFYPGQKEGFMYRKMPRHMLAKDAEAQALRKAFPAQLSSVEYASTADYGGQELIEVNPPEPLMDQKALAAKQERIYGTEEDAQDPIGAVARRTAQATVATPAPTATAATKPEMVSTRSQLGQKLAALVEEAARLEVDFSDAQIEFPASKELVLRLIEKIEDRIQREKDGHAPSTPEQPSLEDIPF